MGSFLSIIFRRKQTAPTTNFTNTNHVEEITFPSSDGSCQLAGSLYFPNGNAAESKELLPAMVIIHGSGPIDRDGNVKGGFMINMTLNTHNRLAEHISSTTTATTRKNQKRRMVVLIYDKRGIQKSCQPHIQNQYERTGMYDLVDDAVQAYQYLVRHPRIDSNHIVLIGHSEGAILLPLVARKIKEHCCDRHTSSNAASSSSSLPPPKGLVFLAGYGESLKDATTNQRRKIVKEISQETGMKGWILRKLVTTERLEKQNNALMKNLYKDHPNQDVLRLYWGLVKFPAKWFREHLAWDAQQELKDSTGGLHCLAITGTKDVQVNCAYCQASPGASGGTARLMASASVASLETHVLPNLTHVLRSLEDGREAKILEVRSDYKRLGKKPLDPELLNILDKWIDRIIYEVD